MESCAKCGTSIFATETQCVRCGQPTPAAAQAAQARAQILATMPPPPFLPPPPRLRMGVGKRVGMILVICCIVLAVFVGITMIGKVPAPWTTRSSTLGIATVEVPDRCALAPEMQRPGAQSQGISCSDTQSFEIDVIDVKISGPTADLATFGRSVLQGTLGTSATTPRPVTTPSGPAYDTYGTGHLQGQPVRFKARIFDIGGSMVIVVGAAVGDDDLHEADYERAIRSVRAAGTP
jgi:hypothetical protein